MKICQENQYLVKIRQKYWAPHTKNELHFIVAVIKALLCNNKYFHVVDMLHFHYKIHYTNMPQCYFIHTVPLLY